MIMESDFEQVHDSNNNNEKLFLTEEQKKKALKAQILLGIISLIMIAIPGILFWIFGRN